MLPLPFLTCMPSTSPFSLPTLTQFPPGVISCLSSAFLFFFFFFHLIGERTATAQNPSQLNADGGGGARNHANACGVDGISNRP